MTFDGKSEKFELVEDLFHTMIKMLPVMTEQMKINHFYSLLRKGALQTFRNINTINRQTLENVLVIFRRKYVKPESQATAKHKWHRLIFDPNTMKLPDFLEELNQGAEKAFDENAKSMIDSLLYAKLPSKLKRSVNMARLENGTYEEIVAHLERELELNALEDSDDLPIATMASASTNSRSLLSTGIDTNKEAQCAYGKANGHFYKNCPKLKKKKELEDKTGKKSQRLTDPPCDTWPIHFQKARVKKLISPRLKIHDYMSVRQNVLSDPPIINIRQYIKDTSGIPSVFWQQQMEKAYIKTYKPVHIDHPDRYYDLDNTKDLETQFRPLPLIEDYNPQYIDPDYGKDLYWDDEIYDKQNLHFRRDDYPPTADEEDPEIGDNKLTRALLEPWQTNSGAMFSEMEESYQQEDPKALLAVWMKQPFCTF